MQMELFDISKFHGILNDVCDHFNLSEFQIKRLCKGFFRVKKGETISLNNLENELLILYSGIMYHYEVLDSDKKKVCCLLDNEFYGNYSVVAKSNNKLIDILTEKDDSLKGFLLKNEENEPKGVYFKCIEDSIILVLNTKNILKYPSSYKIVLTYWMNYSSLQDKCNKVNQASSISEKIHIIRKLFPSLLMNFDESIIANYFGINYNSWRKLKNSD